MNSMTERICPACNHRNDLAANYCSSCGERISGPEEPTAAIPVVEDHSVETKAHEHLGDRESFASSEGILVVDEGPISGSRYALDTEVVAAGRHPESEIFLDDVTVSRRHAEIHHDGSVFRARDVGSLNGTYVNKQLIDEVELADGDVVQIGRFKLVFFHGTNAQRS